MYNIQFFRALLLLIYFQPDNAERLVATSDNGFLLYLDICHMLFVFRTSQQKYAWRQ